ncbi:MAG: hypothetical protein MH208_01065 [Marinobacter sp.]|nr:hypothetical protein [Marinobacter sp.]
MGKRWPGHRAGQFALVTFDRVEGAHPFSLSCADNATGQLSFQIKALGDYTRKIPAAVAQWPGGDARRPLWSF